MKAFLLLLLVQCTLLAAEGTRTYAQVYLPDTDQDGIEDVYELFGYSSNGQFLDYPAFGAHPFRKDIFVEIDVMQGISMPANALQNVITSFANAQVVNPDGSSGINLFFDASGSVPFSLEIDFQDLFDTQGHRINPRITKTSNRQ